MKNPNIVFTAPFVTEIIDKEIREIGENEVLVESVCHTISAGTERANLVGDANVSPTVGARVKFPRQCGYSASGVVVKVGDAVTRVKVGDRVACSWTKYSRFNVLDEKKVYTLPDAVGFDVASMVHIATFPMGALRKCRLEVGESAIVMGLGILGMLGVALLRAAGATPIVAVDPVAERREQALALGADYALDPFADGFAERVKELTNGGAKVALEVTGKGQGLDMVLDCMARYGRVALLGCTRNSDFSIDYYRKVHWMGVTMVGAHTMARPKVESSDGWWTELDDAEAIIKLLATKRMDFKSLIAETHAISEAPAVFDRLAKEPSFPVVQFDWTKN